MSLHRTLYLTLSAVYFFISIFYVFFADHWLEWNMNAVPRASIAPGVRSAISGGGFYGAVASGVVCTLAMAPSPAVNRLAGGGLLISNAVLAIHALAARTESDSPHALSHPLLLLVLVGTTVCALVLLVAADGGAKPTKPSGPRSRGWLMIAAGFILLAMGSAATFFPTAYFANFSPEVAKTLSAGEVRFLDKAYELCYGPIATATGAFVVAAGVANTDSTARGVGSGFLYGAVFLFIGKHFTSGYALLSAEMFTIYGVIAPLLVIGSALMVWKRGPATTATAAEGDAKSKTA